MIASHDKFLLNLARTRHFESHKLTLVDAIKSNPRQYLLAKIKEFNFHSLGNTEPLLRQAFNIKIVITPELVELIKLRNDVVHRNGHNKAGQAIKLTHDVVLAAMPQVEALVSDVEQQAVSLLAEDSQYAG